MTKPKQSLRDVARELRGGEDHRHVWESKMPVLRGRDGKLVKLGQSGVPWEGPCECICGQSRWLHGGFVGHDLRTMDGLLNRMHELKAKLDAGEEFDEQDQKDLELIANAMMEAINSFIEALRPILESAAAFLADFWANLPDVLKQPLIAYRDLDLTVDPVQSVTIVDSAGVPLYEIPITPEPKLATEIRSDEDQVYPELTMEGEPGWEAEGTFDVEEVYSPEGGNIDLASINILPAANDQIQQIARQAWPNLGGR